VELTLVDDAVVEPNHGKNYHEKGNFGGILIIPMKEILI
jgi:hypothetical protein